MRILASRNPKNHLPSSKIQLMGCELVILWQERIKFTSRMPRTIATRVKYMAHSWLNYENIGMITTTPRCSYDSHCKHGTLISLLQPSTLQCKYFEIRRHSTKNWRVGNNNPDLPTCEHVFFHSPYSSPQQAAGHDQRSIVNPSSSTGHATFDLNADG